MTNLNIDINEGISLIKEHSVALKECNVFPVGNSIFKLNDNIQIILDKNILASSICSTEYGVDPICIEPPIEAIAKELDRYIFTECMFANPNNIIYVMVSGSIGNTHIEQAISKLVGESGEPKFYFNNALAWSYVDYMSPYQLIPVQSFPVNPLPDKVFGVFGNFKKYYLGINRISSFEKPIDYDSFENGYIIDLGGSLDPDHTFVVFKWV